MAQALLTLQNVYKYYTGNQSVVMGLNNVNLTLHSGEFVAITGESGSGKSTLAQVICGILPYESGEMRIAGQPTSHYDSSDWERHRREKISFISQNYGILPGSTVLTNVVTALRITGMDKGAAVTKAEELLRLVELWELRKRRAGKLSSGPKQRLSIARALAKPAPILVADEPTGNLDPENSAKVIQLLARAAQERLVILITHDFQEAENYATRRIQLQDGQVVSDAQLRPFVPCESQAAATPAKKNLSLFVSRLQVSGRMVWSSLVALFFTLTAFGVFAFLGTFILHLDDSSTRIYDTSGFVNGDPKRIVVQRTDLAPMTEADWNAILSVKYAESLERSGYLADISYAWRQDVDYELHYTVENRGNDESRYQVLTSTVEILKDKTAFVQTVPLLPGEQTFLSAGRLPENLYEVVLAGDNSRIGEQFSVYLKDQKNWSVADYVRIDVTVVGTTKHGNGLYFHDDLGTAFTGHILNGGWSDAAWLVFPLYDTSSRMDADLFRETAAGAWPETGVEYYTEENGEEFVRLFLPDSKSCALSEAMYRRYERYYQNSDSPIYIRLADLTEEGTVNSAIAIGYHDSTYPAFVQVAPSVFQSIAYSHNADQVSLTIKDYAYADRVLAQLQSMGYMAVSPFQQGATEKDPALAAQRMQTLLVCVAALAAVVLLMVLVLRELFGIQTESYKLLADMGLGCATAQKSMLWQILGFAVVGQILSFGIIQLLGAMGIQRVNALLRYLPVANWLVLSGVHFVLSLISATLAIGSMKKKVYPQSQQRADLDMGEEADA